MFGEGFRLVAAGVAIGIAGALVASRVLQSFLFEVEPTDPIAYTGAAAMVALITLLASYLPARRAAGVNPIVALRQE